MPFHAVRHMRRTSCSVFSPEPFLSMGDAKSVCKHITPRLYGDCRSFITEILTAQAGFGVDADHVTRRSSTGVKLFFLNNCSYIYILSEHHTFFDH